MIKNFSKNASILMKATWEDMFSMLSQTIGSGLIWGILFFFFGLIIGLMSYFVLRHRGLFNLKRNRAWYRYVRWAWMPVFFLLPAIGGCYSGVWFGGSRTLKRHVQEKKVFNRAVINICNAAIVTAAGYELSDNKTSQELQDIAVEIQEIEDVVRDAFEEKQFMLTSFENETFRASILKKFLNPLTGKITKVLLNPEIRFYCLLHYENQSQLGCNKTVAVFDDILKAGNMAFCQSVNLTAYPNVVIGLLFGCGIPLFFFLVFRLVDYASDKNKLKKNSSGK